MREECERDIQSMMMTKKVFNFCKSLLFLPRLEILVRIEEEQVCEPGVSSQILLLVFLGLFEDTRVKHPSIYSYSHVIQIGMKIGMFAYLTTEEVSSLHAPGFTRSLLCSIIDSVFLSLLETMNERTVQSVSLAFSCFFLPKTCVIPVVHSFSGIFRREREREKEVCALLRPSLVDLIPFLNLADCPSPLLVSSGYPGISSHCL